MRAGLRDGLRPYGCRRRARGVARRGKNLPPLNVHTRPRSGYGSLSGVGGDDFRRKAITMGATMANRTIQFGVGTKRETKMVISNVTTSASTTRSVKISSLDLAVSDSTMRSCAFTGFSPRYSTIPQQLVRTDCRVETSTVRIGGQHVLCHRFGRHDLRISQALVLWLQPVGAAATLHRS